MKKKNFLKQIIILFILHIGMLLMCFSAYLSNTSYIFSATDVYLYFYI